MKPLRSIRWRLLLWYGVWLALMLSGLGITVYHFEKIGKLTAIDDDLQKRSIFLANSTRPERSSGKREKALRLSPENAHYLDDGTTYYAVWLKNGLPFTASSSAPADIPMPDENASGLRTRGEWREAFVSPAPDDYMLAGRSLKPIHDKLQILAAVLSASGLLVLALGLIGGWWLVTLSLRPIRSITETAGKIADGDLTQRINIRETESELGALAGILNNTFSRLDMAFAQQRQFTADAAHELRTPVSVILTHAQNGLNLSENNEEEKEAFSACQRAAQRMRRLIESLLQLTRFQAGHEELQRLPCDLNLIVEEAVELVRPLADERRISFSLDLKESKIQADADRIHQVVVNLLTNAITHGKESGIVSIHTGKKEGLAFCLVSDDGPGIAPEHLPFLFDRFYRADKARTANEGRTGLGLAICKAIMKAHGGRIEVQSSPSNGTRFTALLPLQPLR